MAESIDSPAFTGGEPPRIRAAGDRALLIEFTRGTRGEWWRRVAAAFSALRAAALPSIVNLHPAEGSILVVYDPLRDDAAALTGRLARVLSAARETPAPAGRIIEIPVCYDGPCAPDLPEVAGLRGMTEEALIHAHSQATYFVHFLGFSAGFPYLGGLPEQLATPRLPTPRKRVPPGSVALGGSWTGIYPFATPGGWRLIGRTALRLFDAERSPASLLSLGDEVRFRRVRCES